MVQNSYIEFTEPVVKKLEGFADLLESIEYEAEDWKVVTSLFLLYIESNLPESNIYDFVFKTDESKEEKLSLQENKKIIFDKINENVKFLETSPDNINEMWSTVDRHYETIKGIETEMQNKIDEQYKIIKKIESEYQTKVADQYTMIKQIEKDIEGIHEKTNGISNENNELYKEVETIDFKLSDIENHIEDSEWKVELDSPEEKVFETVKNNLIKNKRLKYGNI